jgi:beta-glucosidase
MALFISGFVQAQTADLSGREQALERIELKIDRLLSQMTLKEKAGQMLNVGLPTILTGDYWDARDSAVFHTDRFKKMIVDYGVGSIHNTPGYLAGKEDWYRMLKEIQDAAMNESRLGIPVLYGIDNIHGANYIKGSVMFPHQIALAATWNPALVGQTAAITSYESRAASLPWNFNPNVDVAATPLWGRIAESFGEDPHLISTMARAYVQGAQQTDLSLPVSSAVCLKHYLGYGAGNNGKDRANALIPERHLRQYFLPPFEAAIKSGAMGVMISSNAVNGVPCHANKYYITDILKGELGFRGVVISDFSDVEFLIGAHQVAADMREATKIAVNAGLDLLMNPYDAKVVDIIVDLVNAQEIPMERIDDAVRRVLRLKYQLNLFETPYNHPDSYPEFAGEKHVSVNYQAACEALTLLKNTQQVLPLPAGKNILVTGYGAHSMNLLNGAWSRTFLGRDTQYNDPTKRTVLEAIEAHNAQGRTSYVAGTDYLTDINTDEAVAKAREADYIVVCVGEIPATEKPSDINELALPTVQQELVKRLSVYKKPLILVMLQGRPRIIREIEPLSAAVLMAYYPGQEGGRAIADILYGKVNPSGKLPYTYPKYSGNLLPYYHKKTDIRDINWGFDGFYPQYEFGHGLSYTTFAYTDLRLDKEQFSGDDSLRISITVENTGDRPGKETVQLYAKDLIATVAPDVKKLIGFQKIFLAPGARKTVLFTIDASDLASVGLYNEWRTETGTFELQLGGQPSKLIRKKIVYHSNNKQ